MKKFIELVEMIRKTKSGYQVLDSKGKKVLGTHESKKKSIETISCHRN